MREEPYGPTVEVRPSRRSCGGEGASLRAAYLHSYHCLDPWNGNRAEHHRAGLARARGVTAGSTKRRRVPPDVTALNICSEALEGRCPEAEPARDSSLDPLVCIPRLAQRSEHDKFLSVAVAKLEEAATLKRAGEELLSQQVSEFADFVDVLRDVAA